MRHFNVWWCTFTIKPAWPQKTRGVKSPHILQLSRIDKVQALKYTQSIPLKDISTGHFCAKLTEPQIIWIWFKDYQLTGRISRICPSCLYTHHKDNWLFSLIPGTSKNNFLGWYIIPNKATKWENKKIQTGGYRVSGYETLTPHCSFPLCLFPTSSMFPNNRKIIDNSPKTHES